MKNGAKVKAGRKEPGLKTALDANIAHLRAANTTWTPKSAAHAHHGTALCMKKEGEWAFVDETKEKSCFEEFLRKYAIKHEVSEREAQKHAIVGEIRKYYEDPEGYRITKKEFVDICGIKRQEELGNVQITIEEYGHPTGSCGC